MTEREQQAKKQQLQSALSDVAAAGASPDQAKRRNSRLQGNTCASRIMGSTLVVVLKRALNGVVTIWLYFADIISDIQVIQLLWVTANWLFAWISIFLLVLQFFVVYCRVLPYLRSTFGSDSAPFRTFRGIMFDIFDWDFEQKKSKV